MSGTGRLTSSLNPRTRRIVYGETDIAGLVRELDETTTVDQAHVVMLVRQGLLPPESGSALLRYIGRLREQRYAPLHALPAPRGVYLMYETHLIDVLGAELGGKLHTGRSRNDLKATATAMRLRETALELGSQLLRLQAVLLSRARAAAHEVMPVYTHFQAAMPVTYGHYLLGVASALDRDIAAFRHATGALRRCPLGAVAVAGTDLPIDTSLTAGLLGFDAPVAHALDAVASRDGALRMTAAAAGAAVTLSRLATDLQLWSTAEFGMIRFADRLVGGSSAMPQKRNAFLLEHIRAKAGTVVAAWTGGMGMTKSTPFTNSIEVGTEAMAAVWPGLRAALDSVLLGQAVVSGARLERERATRRAEEGFVTATALANRLVRAGVPFRTAHHLVGDAVRRAVARGDTELTGLDLPDGIDAPGPDGLRVSAVVSDHRAGGGPGAFDESFGLIRRELCEHGAWLRAWNSQLDAARRSLVIETDKVISHGGDR
ncbi:argininosuccinate lyase [Streptomyces sp. NPDC017529]|uniref:argininosuccinate lyase n=1 Tax=Streptomyces sp. NPDC017529 TaxID=3365000 RepID=UPI003794F11D